MEIDAGVSHRSWGAPCLADVACETWDIPSRSRPDFVKGPLDGEGIVGVFNLVVN